MPFDFRSAPTALPDASTLPRITIHPVVARMRELLGPHGENWLQRDWNIGRRVCLMAALNIAEGRLPKGADMSVSPTVRTLHTIVQRRGYPNITAFNDHPFTTWPDIVAVLGAFDVELSFRSALARRPFGAG